MLGNKKNQKKTVFGGIGIALLLCALMVLMPMSGFVDNNDSTTVELVDAGSNGAEDYFRLPEKIAEADYEYDPSLEIQGMRDQTTKAFLNEDGSITQMLSGEPLHYNADGTWENIDLNIQAYPEGWGVTKNTYATTFAPEVANGIAVQANEFVDPIVSGLNPMLVTLDETGSAPQPFEAPPASQSVEVGGNVIRYPLAEGYDLDYSVEVNQVKQNLILREAPVLQDNAKWFGLSEGLRLPVGYALYSGETMLGEELFSTQEALQIRQIETGELLADIPAPLILEPQMEEPYVGTFFVQVYGNQVLLITVVDADWLMSEDRTFPLALDPTLRVDSAAGGYCSIYSVYCYSSNYRYHSKNYGSYSYVPWHKYTFNSNNKILTGGTINQIQWKKYMSYAYGTNTALTMSILEGCGLDARYNYVISTNACNGNPISASYLSSGYGGTGPRSLVSSVGNSPSAATISSTGTGWKTLTLCNSATACNATSGGVSHVVSAATNGAGTIGVGERSNASVYFYNYAYISSTTNSHFLVTYTGGTDADAPTSDFVPYTGLDSYIEGERTLFIKLTDIVGIDTTSSGGPTLHYTTDGGTTWSSTTYGLGSNNEFDSGELVSIGTCGSSSSTCTFKARTPALSVGDDFRYYWKYQDLYSGANGPNVGYTPALTGSQTTPTPYQIDIVDSDTAPRTHRKMTVLTTDLHSGSYYTPQGFYDRQLTYYNNNDEYFYEFDTSDCGTGAQSCFYAASDTFYSNWIARWNNNPPSGSYGMNSGSTSGSQSLHSDDGGFLQIGAKHGPGMNLIFVYDSTLNKWATVGVGTETGIDTPLTGGSQATPSVSYGYNQAYKFAIPSDFTGTQGHFDFNSTGSYLNVIYTDTLDTVTSLTVSNGGAGHSTANNVATATTGSGSGLTVDVTTSTGVTGLTVSNGGTGHSTANNVTTATTGSGSGLTVDVTTSTGVAGLTVSSTGTNFSNATGVNTTTSGSGTGLTVDVTVTSTTVNNTTTSTTSFTVNTAGSGYAVGDTVTVSSGVAGATDATLSVASLDGIVTSVTVNNAGSGYGVGDTVTVSSGVAGATDATLSVASLDGIVTSVAVNNAASGYAVNDTVTLTSSGVNATLSVSGITDVRTYANTTTALADRVCVTTNGWTYFYRSGTYDRCTSAYYMIYGSTTSYRWSGFALGSGYYGRQDSSGEITYKVRDVQPLPDTFKPEFTHNAMEDSHSKSRVVSVTMMDTGDPASGLNVSTSAGVGPTLYHRITPDGGSAGSWVSTAMSQQSDKSRSECALAVCSWSAEIDDLEVNDTVEYYFTVRDTSTVPSGVNVNTSSTYSFQRGDPTKVFVVEWRDLSYYTYGQLCTVQALFYDVTNEIEFKYDSNCRTTYNSWSIGYMNQARNAGASIAHSSSTTFNSNPGFVPTTNNYRISTDGSTSHAWESFDIGLTELANANTAMSGTSNGNPYLYYCMSSYYWNSYKNYCNANIDLPANFSFEYFGTTYDGDDSNDRVQLGRGGSMYFISNGNTNVQRNLWTYHQPALPYSGSSLARPGTIAPFWTGYNNYYCYVNSNQDCSVYYRVMPYEGKGTDVSADITSDPVWDLIDSPIRINPANDYLVVSSDLTIMPGVEVFVAAGKGISFDGACTKFTALGNASANINITGLNGGEWKGMSFTADCASAGGTDDRHQFSHVNFANTTDAVFRSGSRHDGSGPSCGSSTANCNTGNYTMSDVTFTNVGAVFTHGSGQGTVLSMTDFTIDGVDESCFNLPEDSIVTLKEGSMTDCNLDGGLTDGAVVSVLNSQGGGALTMENITVENAYQNFVRVDLEDVFMSNVSVTNTGTTGYTKHAIDLTPWRSGTQSGSTAYLYNVDVPTYGDGSYIDSMESVELVDVDLGDNDLTFRPGGTAQTGNGPSGDNAVIDTLVAGDIVMYRMHPSVFSEVTASDVYLNGSAILSSTLTMANIDIGAISIAGCGWTMKMDSPSLESFKSSCSSSTAKNTVTIASADFQHGSSANHVIDGRNSFISVGESSITSSTAGNTTEVAKARSGTDILLVEMDLNGNDCSDANGDTGNCAYDVSSSTSNPSMIYFGGLANVSVYRLANAGTANETKIYKADHSVTATLLDGNLNELFRIGSHVTDSNGNTSVWVIVEDSDGTSYGDHIVRAFGTSGVNETYPDNYPDATLASSWYPSGGVTIGTHLDLKLVPAPITFNDPTLDCYKLINDPTYSNLSGNFDGSTNTFSFDDTTITVAADLTLDTCGFVLQGGSLRVESTATSSPVIVLKDTGFITANNDGTSGLPAAIRAVSSTYGLHIDIQDGGVLTLDHANLRDVAWDATTKSGLYIGNGATLNMMDSANIFGSTATADDMATVKINGGSANIDASSIVNTGQTGTAIWIENSAASLSDITVRNAAVGIQSYNGAPQIDGFTSNGNTVGVDVHGGMSLPTLYRSSALSGMSAGWHTYKIDISTFLGTGDYLQVGANSIFGGGNAHPSYNYATSKYYWVSDRMNIMMVDDQGNEWNITDSGQEGYYPYGSNDPAVVAGTHTYSGGTGGAPSWHCNYYSYNYGPNYNSWDGYYYYMYYYWLGKSVSYPDYYEAPDEFGFGWENIPNVSPTGSYAYYPYKYWGYYSPSNYFSGVYAPPEGSNGQPSTGPGQPGNVGNPPSYAAGGYPNNYGVCLDYAYTYYMSAGQGARMTFPVVDISNAVANGGNISKIYVWMDVIHRGNDNYQDRYDFVARSGNDPSDLGNYVRESGTPLITNGEILNADYGLQIGGAFAAGHYENIDVTNPTQAGVYVDGQTSATSNGINVSGGNYGVLVDRAASGNFDMENLDLENQNNAGVFYQSDLSGALTGLITGSAGAALKYGTGTSRNVEFDNLTISSNAIGIEAGGTGDFTLTDMTFSNTKDVVISGSSVVDVIEGSITTSTVEVTGTGVLNRLRQLDISVEADVDGTMEDVVDTSVVLKDSAGNIVGQAVSDANGVANDLTFPTQKVDSGSCSSVCALSLTGYEAVTVATIEYYWVSSTNNSADFRYDYHALTLTDTSGNSDTMELVDTFTARVCYPSSSYTSQAPCAAGLSTYNSRTYTNGLVEYSYYYSHSGSDLEGETVMMDAAFMYLDGGKHSWNGTTFINTASYDYDGATRMYPQYNGDNSLYMHDADWSSMALSDQGEPQGFTLGYRYYSMNMDIHNTTMSGVASVIGAMGYGYYSNYELDFLSITDSTFVHYKGYTELNGGNTIYMNDMCLIMNGGDGNVIDGNTFTNCGVGAFIERSPYYYTHNANEVGVDNVTITNNVFTDGGEIADIWYYGSNEAQGANISGNDLNPSGGHAIAIYSGNTKNVLIQDNTVSGGEDPIYLNRVHNFEIDNNDITGIADATSTGIYTYRGSGNITDNTLTDADGGLYIDSMEAPPSPTSSLCSIGANDYRRTDTCSWTISSGSSVDVNLGTDSWGYEISIEITKPDGTKDTWGTYSFSSNSQYTPLRSYSDAGNYTLVVTDSYGDGGATINVLESSGGSGGYAGPIISGNTIGLSAGRTAPNAVGLTAEDCDSVTVQSSMNTITLDDNAIVLLDCDFSDVGSTITGGDYASTIGIVGDDTNTALTLNGTDVSGFATGVHKENGDLTLIGGASLAGDEYGVFAQDTYVVAIDAHVDGGSTGTGLHVEDSPNAWVYPMDASGAIGMYVENTPFRWDGGVSDATTTLSVVDATGTVENMTWAASSTQIDAGSNAHVTSIGNTLDPSKINVASSAVIDEANLLSLEATHLGAAPGYEVGLMVMSTDLERASYVSPSFQPDVMTVDGSDEDWNGGNALNPSGYAMPGKMSGDGTDDFLVTYVQGDGLYFGMTDTDLTASDVLIYISTGTGGSDVGYNGLGGAHNLPFNANYVLWADSASSYDLYSYGFLGWSPSSLSTANIAMDASTSLVEFGVPWSRLGGMPDEVDIVAVVQAETSADVDVVHPSQTLDAGATLQNLSKYMTVELTHGDLAEGVLTDEVLVYQSYKGTTTATGQKNYDLMVKTQAACAFDWATVDDISMATNVVFDDAYVAGTGDTTDVQSTIDIERACPVIDTEGTDPTSDGLVDFTRDEDSGAVTFSLTNLADDVQDLEGDLTWTMTKGTVLSHDNDLIGTPVLNGHDVTILPKTDQFGTVVLSFEVTDSNGLSDDHNITFEVENINDAPVICAGNPVAGDDCMPIFSEDEANYNILPEGFGTHTKFLGDVSNATRSYIRDMANEQIPTRQIYTWTAEAVDLGTTDACSAFDVAINNNELTITENTNNELGGKCTVTLGLSDDGAENQEADTYDVVFSVAPVNDAPVIMDWNRTTDTVMKADNGSIPALPWSISLMEDDESAANLTYDLSAIMADVDHDLDDLTWTVESTDQCVYTNYFTTTIVGNDLVFDLIEDATTNANDWEIDYLNNNGIHQIGPSGSEYCQIRLVLRDTATAPMVEGVYNTYVPNYDPSVMPIATYEQGVATKEIGVRVQNVREQVPDYYFDDVTGFNFNGVTSVMTGTYVPVTVTVGGGGDEGPYRYDHMLAITYHTDGHDDVELTRYYAVPDYGASVKYTEDVYITRDTTHVWVEMDVVTCLANPCDLGVTVADRFQADEPASHYAIINNVQSTDDWSKPGQYGKNATKTSERRPLLEDSNWCNNIMTSLETANVCNHANQPASTFLATNQNLPDVVDTIGASSVPSFAPSVIAVALAGLFVSALSFSSRRADDEEDVEAMVGDDAAVSPVIATILMVAITVVLSGVIYVWASSLAETDVKGVPRMTFDIEDINGFDADQGHWRITVEQSQTPLATQAVEVAVTYLNATGQIVVYSVNLADSAGVYGFSPENSDAFVTFVDSVQKEGNRSISTFNTGDTIFVRTHAPDGTPLVDVDIQLSYAPLNGKGSVLKKYGDLSYDKKA